MEPKTWNALISSLPKPHFLQTHEWGQVKAKYGWTPLYAVWTADGQFSLLKETDEWAPEAFPCSAASLILRRVISLGGMSARLSILYTPKGPLLDWADEVLRNRVLTDLQALAKKQGAIFLKADPDVALGTGVPGSDGDVSHPEGQAVQAALLGRGWRYSADQIQFRNTVLIDLDRSDAELLGPYETKDALQCPAC